MNSIRRPKESPPLHRFILAVLICGVASPSQAQAPASTTPSRSQTAPAAPNAQTPATPPNSNSEVVVLDPFDVRSTGTRRYLAPNSISGTAMNALLKDVPMTINVITSDFLEDLSVGSFERALDYNSSIVQTTRGEVTNRNGIMSIRGFRNRNLLLDGVLASDFLPTYLIDRIEVVKGPNTLYGQSDPGGLVNVISKRPGGKTGASATFKYDSFDTRQVDGDVNFAKIVKGVDVRLLGSYSTTNGWRWRDDRETAFGAAMIDWQVGPATKLRLLLGANTVEGQPSNRATYPFMQVPTDLNGDGDILDNVGGVDERDARFNNNFVPREWTSQTRNSFLEQGGQYAQINALQKLGENADLQYTFMQTYSTTKTMFREFNTFTTAGVNQGVFTTNDDVDRSDAHTLNGLLRLTTGPINHAILAGGRYTKDKLYSEAFRLRPNNAAERAVLNSMIASGRNIRLQVTRADIENQVPIWNDDTPTFDELKRAGFLVSNQADRFEEITTFYLSDSAAMFDERLRFLGGVRNIEIVNYAYNRDGTGGEKRTSRDTSYQVGVNYALGKSFVLFANHATSFNPNGIDPTTGEYYAPEESIATEAGVKVDGLWEGKISGSVAVFLIDKKNVVRTDFNPFTFVNDRDITDDRSEGVDVELFIDATENWQTVLGYSYVDGRTVEGQTAAVGLRLEGAAPHKFTFWTSYGFTQGPLKGLRFGGGGIYTKGPIPQFGTSLNRYVLEDGYTELSAFARYSTKLFNQNATFGINVSNFTDTFYIRARANTNTPRLIVGSLRLDF
jgi:iron complex outermembrane recepter protein